MDKLQDPELLRYSRHVLLEEIGVEGQALISRAKVLLIGVGGLGSPASLYLASSGVGKLTLVDHDQVDLTNLQRQIVHDQSSVGEYKVNSAKARLQALNPHIRVDTVDKHAALDNIEVLVSTHDYVLDCSDNFATRQLVNRMCVKFHKPLISGAAIRWDGQLAVYDLRKADVACYACVFPEHSQPEEVRCAVMGVFAPVVGMVGIMQANLCLQLILGCATCHNTFILIDGRQLKFDTIAVSKRADCSVCSKPQ